MDQEVLRLISKMNTLASTLTTPPELKNVKSLSVFPKDMKQLISKLIEIAEKHPGLGQVLEGLQGFFFHGTDLISYPYPSPNRLVAARGYYDPYSDVVHVGPLEGDTIEHELGHAVFNRNPELQKYAQMLFEEASPSIQKARRRQFFNPNVRRLGYNPYYSVDAEAFAEGWKPTMEEDWTSWSNFMLSDLRTSLDQLMEKYPRSKKYIKRIGVPRISVFDEGR